RCATDALSNALLAGGAEFHSTSRSEVSIFIRFYFARRLTRVCSRADKARLTRESVSGNADEFGTSGRRRTIQADDRPCSAAGGPRGVRSSTIFSDGPPSRRGGSQC